MAYNPDLGKVRTVLLAMDGSKHSEHAFKWYAENVHRKTDKVVITHCTEEFHIQPTDFLGMNEMNVDELYQKHKENYKAVGDHIKNLAEKHKIAHKYEQLHGHAGHAIVKAAEQNNVGMIICGSRGQGVIRRTILGSISDYILHHARMPVVICKHEEEQAKLHQH